LYQVYGDPSNVAINQKLLRGLLVVVANGKLMPDALLDPDFQFSKSIFDLV
jgi:hypothetical protein